MKDKFEDRYGDTYKGSSVVDHARQILAMHQRILEQDAELHELRKYRDLYFEQLDQGIQHSKRMIGSILELAMVPGVMTAIGEHNANKESA
jgi:hypothetical protein